MPDATAGLFTGVYWVVRGKTPAEDLQEGDDDPELPEDMQDDIYGQQEDYDRQFGG